MDIKEYKEILGKELAGITEDMATKTTTEIGESIIGLETKMTDIMAEKFKATEESATERKELIGELEKSDI